GGGVLRVVEAHAKLGETGEEHALAVLAWRTMVLTPTVEATLIRRYPRVLAAHHTARLDFLLWEGEFLAARRMFPRVTEGWRHLAEARMALARAAPGVDALIEKVPEPRRADPGLAYERFAWRARKGRSEDAIALLRATSTGAAALGEPERWASWRRIYARQAMRDGDMPLAYEIASTHHLVAGAAFADLEWLAGYLALRFLEDPETALSHFERFEAAVKTPISLGRGGYWRGRAHTALGDTEAAQQAYTQGATWQTSFYGLLSAEAADLPLDASMAGREVFPAIPTTSLANNSVLAAGLLLLEAEEPALAERFLTHLVESLERPEAGALGKLMLDLGEPHIALMIGKRAASGGMVLPAAYFP
ncbi:MAG: lytic transglycosylase domain-containing protein, partial [Pseudomonadota bacterium]